MVNQLRKAIITLVARGAERSVQEDVRKVQGFAAKALKSAESAQEVLASLASIEAEFNAEVASWVSADDLKNGVSGPFDSRDLRHWLALSERAGVPYVPAVEILSLNEEELSAASGVVEIPDNPLSRGIKRRFDKIKDSLHLGGQPPSVDLSLDVGNIYERMYSAMDEVPEGWMVRSNLCGGDELKSLAGAGVALDSAPSVPFSSDLEVGPGWVRNGNRRRVNVSDKRTISMAASSGSGAVFLARPWIPAKRYFGGDDPHRHGTVFAGKGYWPSEWRVFIEHGKVVGVASYYAWSGEVSSENAAVALEVRELAQRVADQAVMQKAIPRFMDLELARSRKNPLPEVEKFLSEFHREDVSFSLDFIESENGLMVLEGGPFHSIFGGAHPCAFAGYGGVPKFPNRVKTQGVAFKLMDGVSLMNPGTWSETNREECILDWDDVAAIANNRQSIP